MNFFKPNTAGGLIVLDGDTDQPWITPFVRQKFKDLGVARGFETPRGLKGTVLRIDNLGKWGLSRAFVYSVHLPFKPLLHMFAVSPDSHVLLQQDKIEPVVLEGNYQSYFKLFALKGQQVETRYMLDPAAMETTMTYLHQYVWEVWGDTLYVFCEANFPSVDIFDTLVEEIRPAVATENSVFPVVDAKAYRVLDDETLSLRCSVCAEPMLQSMYGYACRFGHGFIVSDRQLRYMSQAPAGHFIAATVKKDFARPSDSFGYLKDIDKVEFPSQPTCWFCLGLLQSATLESGTTYQDCQDCQYNWITSS